MQRNIVLMGFKSCGKSFWGKRLAQALDWEWIDTDRLLAPDCRELAREIGEEAFRKHEAGVLLRLREKEQCVISLGGGAPLAAPDLLPTLGTIVFLDVKRAVIKQRILEGGLPTFLESEEDFDRVYDMRYPLYLKLAEIRVESGEQLLSQVQSLSV